VPRLTRYPQTRLSFTCGSVAFLLSMYVCLLRIWKALELLVWSAYLAIWPIDAMSARWGWRLDPGGGRLGVAFDWYARQWSYLFLSALCLTVARLGLLGMLRVWGRPTRLSGRNGGLYPVSVSWSILTALTIVYGLALWLRPFINLALFCAVCWIVALAVSVSHRGEQKGSV